MGNANDSVRKTPTCEPFFSKAKVREAVYMKATKFTNGKPEAPVITEIIPEGGMK